MHKLVILIEASEAWQDAEALWPEFLHLVERMPGLRREAISRVDRNLLGPGYIQAHELFFDSPSDAEKALNSPDGRLAGRLLQQMTGGRMALFLADHKEDDLANIQKYQRQEGQSA